MENMLKVCDNVDVLPLLTELHTHKELWNSIPARTENKNSPHYGADDIWVRYNDPSNLAAGDTPHFAVWYPAYHKLPALRSIIFPLMARFSATQLGGILITRIPPGGSIKPHVDSGWHPAHYPLKLYVVLKGNDKCVNRVGEDRVAMRTGEVWYFDNMVEHAVVNGGDEERITLIICLRTE